MTGLCVICRPYKQAGMCLCPPAFDAGSVVDLTECVIRLDTPVLTWNRGDLTLCTEVVSSNEI
jgi:hypothetical protein